MTENDLLLLAILAIGVCWINWQVIKGDFFPRNISAHPHHSGKKATNSSPEEKIFSRNIFFESGVKKNSEQL
jgi:hypothetical protein